MKKKYLLLALGASVVMLASCGSTGSATTTTASDVTTTSSDVTTTASDVTTTEDAEETSTVSHEHPLTRKYAKDPTYKKDGNIAYKYCSTCDKYFDLDLNEISSSDVIIPRKNLTGTVTAVNGETVVTDLDKSLLEDKFYLGDVLTVTNGVASLDMTVSYFKEALKADDYGLIFDTNVCIEKNGDVAEALFAEGDTLTVTYKETVDYEYTVKLFNYMEENKKDLSEASLVDGNDIEIEYKSDDYDTYHELYNTIIEAMNAGEKEYSEIDELYTTFCDNYAFLYDQYLKVELMADKTAEETYYDLSGELYDLLSDIETQDQKIDLAAASSVYRNSYYEDMTDEEINDYVATLDPEQSEAINTASSAMQDALNSYYAGDTDAITALKAYCTSAKTLATLEGYEDYLSYCYPEVYDREYEVSDTAEIKTYVKEYVSKTLDLVTDAWYDFRANCTDEEWNEFYGYYADFFAENMGYINDYSLLVGGDYRSDFIKYFTSGNYYYSNLENDNVTGYCNVFYDGTPFMFLGADYQDTSTFIHEFGHYNAFMTGGGFGSYDLCETQSQGDEALFYLYMDKNVGGEASRGYLLWNAYNLLSTVEEGFMINELEKYVYTADPDTLTLESINSKWNEIAAEMGLDDYVSESTDSSTMEWVMAVLLNYQGYYISYSVSAVASLEVFAEGMTDYDKALESYRYIYADNDDDTFTEVLIGSGLEDVFSEDAYKNIYNAFEAYLA